MDFSIKNKINSINWDFKGHDTQYMTHGIHKYPARMIPQIAHALIEAFSKDGDLVFDPFCGSGTVPTEAYLMNRKAIGNDLNPLALLLSRVRTTPINTQNVKNIVDKICSIDKKDNYKDNEIFVDVNIDYWFKNYVIQDLIYLKNEINKSKLSNIEKDFLKVCFSATVRETSNVRQGEYKLYRIPEEKLNKYKPNVLKTFFSISNKYMEKMNEFNDYIKTNKISKDVTLTKYDSRFLPKETFKNKSVDLIVTSPPYGDSRTTVAYGQFSRYSLIWLGLEKEEVYNLDKNLLGGKVSKLEKNYKSPTFNRILKKIGEIDNKRAEDTLWFVNDLYLTIVEMSRVLKKGGHACIVIGNRTVRRVKVPTSKIIEEIATTLPEGFRFSHELTIGRNIPTKNNPISSKFKLPDGTEVWINTMSSEDIVILKKL